MYISTPPSPEVEIFKLKFTTPPGIEPRTCWTRGRAGFGKVRGRKSPLFAKVSACSFPWIEQCPGIHCRTRVLLFFESSCRRSWLAFISKEPGRKVWLTDWITALLNLSKCTVSCCSATLIAWTSPSYANVYCPTGTKCRKYQLMHSYVQLF